jgi:phosphohistidine phosphatase
METLILLRHGKAVRDNEAPDDRSRNLTARGRADAAAAGEALARDGLRPDRVLVSPAARTRETFLAAAPALGRPHVRIVEDLYMADAETIWRCAAAAGGSRILVVGHNPGLHELCSRLLDEARDRSALALRLRDRFTTATFAAFALTSPVLGGAGPTLIAGWSPPN